MAKRTVPFLVANPCGTDPRALDLMVLSACYGAEAEEALIAHVDCVVGMSGALHDQADQAARTAECSP